VRQESTSHFNIHGGCGLTANVKPILHEIRHALEKLLDTGESTMIDLRSIPLAPGEMDTIIETLGRGEVSAELQALGPSEIYETRFAGVWMVAHLNDNRSLVSRFIEITEIPDILRSQQQDMSYALASLETELNAKLSS
jgi:hydrogenase-1 operon protein HyaF